MGVSRLISIAAALVVAGCTTGPVREDPASSGSSPDAAVLNIYAAGDIADCRHATADATAARRTADLIAPGAVVLALGDIAYPLATSATLAACYDPTWGRHRATTYPVAGNHDYAAGATAAMRDYFRLQTEPRFVAYAKWLSSEWLLLVLDSNVTGADLTAQYDWLQRLLQREFGTPPAATDAAAIADKSRCVMVAWHAPLYSSGLHRGAGARMRPFWSLLDRYDADLVLSGHEHFYEGFDPMNGTGVQQPEGAGLRQFVVGTGGARLYGFWKPPYASRARVLQHGVLAMQLGHGSYSWNFLALDGKTYDRGTAACRHHSPASSTALN